MKKHNNAMEPEKPKAQLSAQEQLARDAQRERVLLRNVLWLTLWTLVALIPTLFLVFVEMPGVWRVITGFSAPCFGCWPCEACSGSLAWRTQ